MVRIYNIEKSRYGLNKGKAILNTLGGSLLYGGGKIKQWLVSGESIGNVVANSGGKTINNLTQMGGATLWGIIKKLRVFINQTYGLGYDGRSSYHLYRF